MLSRPLDKTGKGATVQLAGVDVSVGLQLQAVAGCRLRLQSLNQSVGRYAHASHFFLDSPLIPLDSLKESSSAG
jgi:hypothetical protein